MPVTHGVGSTRLTVKPVGGPVPKVQGTTWPHTHTNGKTESLASNNSMKGGGKGKIPSRMARGEGKIKTLLKTGFSVKSGMKL